MPYKILSRFADNNLGYGANGDAQHQALGDYSVTAKEFKITAQAQEHIVITRMVAGMEAADFDRGDYYGAVGALTNGISIYVTDKLGTIQYRLTDTHKPIVNVTAWAHYCYDYTVFPNVGPLGEESAAARWTFAKSGTDVVLLPGWSINVLCQDDFSATGADLDDHHFLFQGHYRQPTIGNDAGHA